MAFEIQGNSIVLNRNGQNLRAYFRELNPGIEPINLKDHLVKVVAMRILR